MKINLTDLPKSEFKISIEKNAIHSILTDTKLKGESLYQKFSEIKSQRNTKIISIKKIF